MESAIWFAIAVLALILNSFFVLAKFSFIRLRKEHLIALTEDEEQDDGRWESLIPLYDNPNLFLGAVQVMRLSLIAITTCSVLYGWYMLVWSIDIAEEIRFLSVLCVFAATVFLEWLLSELLPKSIGLSFALQCLPRVAGVVRVIIRILRWPLAFGEWCANRLLQRWGIQVTSEIEVSHSEEEIRYLINASHLSGQFDQREGELIQNAFDFVDRLAREVMVPRQDVTVLYYDDDLETMRSTIQSARHTRYPLCDGDKDHIVGLIHVKNFMELYINGGTNIKDIVTEISVIPEVMPIMDLLQLMRARLIYLAVVVDEFGGMVGLVALEDIIEELVGDIQDEHDVPEEIAIQEHSDGSYEFDGSVILEDVEKCLGIDFEEADSDTIGGYVFSLLERIPRIGDHVQIGGWDFRVAKLRGFRIIRLLATPLRRPNDEVET